MSIKKHEDDITCTEATFTHVNDVATTFGKDKSGNYKIEKYLVPTLIHLIDSGNDSVGIYLKTDIKATEFAQAVCDLCNLLDLEKNPKLQTIDYDHMRKRVSQWI